MFEAETVLLEDGNKVAKSSVEGPSEVVMSSELVGLVGLGIVDSVPDEVRPDTVGSAVTPLAPKEVEEGTIAEVAAGSDDVPLRELETTAVKFRFR